jgi:Family of unknown function (DUF6529)
METAGPAAPRETRPAPWLLVPVVAGFLVSLTVGIVAGHADTSNPKGYFHLFFSDPIHLKAWFATAAALGACGQVFLAAWIFRKLPWSRPGWVPAAHRWVGRLTFVATLPVAYHCVFKLGYQTYSGRVLAHSLLGTAFFGAFVAKVTIVRLHRFPRWVLPAAGGVVFAVLVALWYTSAYWFFTSVDSGL